MRYLYNVLVQSLWKFFFLFFCGMVSRTDRKKVLLPDLLLSLTSGTSTVSLLKDTVVAQMMKGSNIFHLAMLCVRLHNRSPRWRHTMHCRIWEGARDRWQIQVPVVFSVNGSRIVSEDKHPSFIEYNEDRPLFPYVSFEKENSVLAKVLNILTFFNTFYFF